MLPKNQQIRIFTNKEINVIPNFFLVNKKTDLFFRQKGFSQILSQISFKNTF